MNKSPGRGRHDRRAALTLVGVIAAAVLAGGCDDSEPSVARGVQLVFGRTGMGPREFSYPRAALIDARQRLYIVDKSARIQCFTSGGEHLFDWRMPERMVGKPTGLGLGPDGRVYVADTHYSRVLIFEADGRPVGAFGTRGAGAGQFILPTDVLVDRDGFIYVSEYGGNDRISKFAPDHTYLLSFGGVDAGVARLQRPQSLALGPDGTLWVADACNHRVCRFTRAGEFRGAFGRAGDGLGELRFPYGLDLLSDGTLVVSEYGNNRLQRFDQSGKSLGVWGTAGRAAGELAYPWAVVVGADDRLYVIDSGNNRVQLLDSRVPDFWRKSTTRDPQQTR